MTIPFPSRPVVALALMCSALQTMWCGPVIEDFEDQSRWKGTSERVKIANASPAAVGDGALQVTLPGMAYMNLYYSMPPLENRDWDRYGGVSFWVKGDGGDQFGCLALCGRKYTWGYCHAAYFPLKTTEWTQYTFAWDDFVPESAVRPIGTRGALPPSGIQYLRLGDRWTISHNNRKIPQYTFCIDQIELIEDVGGSAHVPRIRALAEVLDSLKAGTAVHIVCMGDSVTAGTGLHNPDEERYADRMQQQLRTWLGRDSITVESRAVGGASGQNLRAWVARDFAGEPPDLVTIMVGYNDKSAGTSCEFFGYSLSDYVDRIARQTGGRSAILLIPTLPGRRHRFVMMDDYADRVRAVAAQRGLPVCGVQEKFKALGRDGMERLFADLAHPNAEGHRLIADTLCRFLLTQAGVPVP